MPERYYDPATNSIRGQDLRKDWDAMSARVAAEDSRKLTLPQAPDAYRVGTSQAFKPPEGSEFKLDEAHPSWGMARQWAHKHGLSQDAFHEMVDVFAGYQALDAQTQKTAMSAEIAKLGTAGPARVDAVQQWLSAAAGGKFTQLQNVLKVYPVASVVEGFETLMREFSTQGGGSYSGAKREPNQPQRLPESEVAKMTYAERKSYAAQFTQSNAA